MQIIAFLAATFCTATIAEEGSAGVPGDVVEAAVTTDNESNKQPTLLAIILPSLDPVQTVDNSLSQQEYDDDDDTDGDDEDSAEDEMEDGEVMKTARNIVFRPLFTYRQKKLAKRRVQVRRNAARKSSARRNAQKRNAQPAKKYYSRNSYYRPRYPSYYPSYYYNAQFPTIA